MGFKQYNANPDNNRVEDCTIRAISTVLNKSWDEVFICICLTGLMMRNMPSANHVWGQYMRDMGYRRHIIPCRDDPCTVEEFCRTHPEGTFLLCLHEHVVCVMNGDWYDTWDSGGEYPIYYWSKCYEEKEKE